MHLDHICIAVRSIEAAVTRLGPLLGYEPRTRKVTNTRQKVNVLFLSRVGSLDLKLIEPSCEDSPLWASLRKGEGLHHICFKADDTAAALAELQSKGLRVLAPPAPGEAFAPPNAVGEAEPADRRAVQINTYFENIAKRLLAKHGAEHVDVWYRVHRLSHPLEVLDDPANPNDGRKIDDPDTYRERLQLTYKREGVR